MLLQKLFFLTVIIFLHPTWGLYHFLCQPSGLLPVCAHFRHLSFSAHLVLAHVPHSYHLLPCCLSLSFFKTLHYLSSSWSNPNCFYKGFYTVSLLTGALFYVISASSSWALLYSLIESHPLSYSCFIYIVVLHTRTTLPLCYVYHNPSNWY